MAVKAVVAVASVLSLVAVEGSGNWATGQLKKFV